MATVTIRLSAEQARLLQELVEMTDPDTEGRSEVLDVIVGSEQPKVTVLVA